MFAFSSDERPFNIESFSHSIRRPPTGDAPGSSCLASSGFVCSKPVYSVNLSTISWFELRKNEYDDYVLTNSARKVLRKYPKRFPDIRVRFRSMIHKRVNKFQIIEVEQLPTETYDSHNFIFPIKAFICSYICNNKDVLSSEMNAMTDRYIVALEMYIQLSRSMTSSGEIRTAPASCSTFTVKKREEEVLREDPIYVCDNPMDVLRALLSRNVRPLRSPDLTSCDYYL
ncbi:hypothetical protein ANN_09655 [Periplaneta americana]|uniref:Uncharacterized protein n=1 Tax=Periplaneta americana TaxID=6978 RepID=A0ABQ8TP65_PERAM|nr:hypothetical protein ANN_09655 [Periplaneta americana]